MKNAIQEIIENSLTELLEIGEENNIKQNAGARLLFPQYYHGDNKGEKRISEQELRFLLAKKFEEEKIYYSVEAPTKKKYAFTGKEENSRSGLIDLCLYNSEGKRTNLIELKHNGSKNSSNNGSKNTISKDLEKLLFDFEAEQNYFVHLDSSKSKRIERIEAEYEKALKKVLELRRGEKIKSSVKILLFVIREEKLHKYEISKAGKLSKADG